VLAALFTQAQDAQESKCQPAELVFFSCQLQRSAKTVSLCASSKQAPFKAITYRYGANGADELAFTASTDNQQHFSATITPLSPRATIRQVWFETKGVRYIVTSCIGGDCPQNGGLLVKRGSRVLSKQLCTLDSTQPWFSSKVLHFGSDVPSSRSRTELIRLEDVDNNADVLYPMKDR
jgi:hypothetical protein